VGTTFTYLRGSGFFQYSDTFRPCSLSCRNTCGKQEAGHQPLQGVAVA
jgi:hypothetical protein